VRILMLSPQQDFSVHGAMASGFGIIPFFFIGFLCTATTASLAQCLRLGIPVAVSVCTVATAPLAVQFITLRKMRIWCA